MLEDDCQKKKKKKKKGTPVKYGVFRRLHFLRSGGVVTSALVKQYWESHFNAREDMGEFNLQPRLWVETWSH